MKTPSQWRPAAVAATTPDQLVQWLLAGIEWKTTVFHVGQYCGRWKASTAGRGLASFHAVLRGRCWLHRPGHPSLLLDEGDAVFLLHDEPHHLSPDPDSAVDLKRLAMHPTLPVQPDGTALACGFFHFAGPLSTWLAAAVGEPLLLRSADAPADLRHAVQLFEWMRDEADRSACGCSDDPEDLPSPLLERLTGLLFHYVLRHVLSHDGEIATLAGPWALARHPRFSPVLQALLQAPEEDWPVERMAALVHLSRASFFRAFVQACGEPPAQFLQRLRMQLAAQRLYRGESIERTAGLVGYQSTAAFTRVFQRVLGEQPGAWQRARRSAGARSH